jgi:lysophospholipase L1-like esterase
MKLYAHLARLGAVLGLSISSPPVSLYPYDQTWIRKWASIGDSYASGLGSGARVDYSCSRYDGGYPSILMRDDRIGSNTTKYQHLACSGLKSTDILKKQVPHLKNGLDVITISAGGNDVGLGDVLDACIFQWKRSTSEDCDLALNRSQSLIDTVLDRNIDTLLKELTPKLSKTGKIYYPGYATFFGPSPGCNNVSWSVWPRMPDADKQNLTVARREKMNDMVLQVNNRLKTSVEKLGSRAVFIDWDWTFTQINGRFCEDDVIEPEPDRPELLFYEWNTLDDGEDPHLIINPGDPVPKDSFEGDIGKWILETLAEYPDWGFGPTGDDPVTLDLLQAEKIKAQLGFDDFVFWFLPDSWKRVFHPRAMGHHIIAGMILHEMAITKANQLGIAMLDEPPTAESLRKLPSKMEL